MRKNRKYITYLLSFGLLLFILITIPLQWNRAEAVETTTYTVNATGLPYKNRYITYRTYNTNTKQYYMLRSYLEQLEKEGGGTLVLSKGTYVLTNTLYVPSHVTIRFKDGVILRKIEQTGVDWFAASKSIFQLAAPSKSKTVGAYSGYQGETDINIIGEGKVIINLDFVKNAIGIVLGHNTKVLISGITFQNMQSGHFIELDASSGVTIEKNQFLYHKSSDAGNKEAINIDTPDKNTKGFNADWTSYDCTPNKDIVIQSNHFEDLERAIGTHKYSEGKYHDNIQILKNTIKNTTSDAIRIINWVNPIIKGNEINVVAGGAGTDRAILVSGCKNPTITENTFAFVPRPIQFMPWKNNGDGKQYSITYNELSKENIRLMLKNYLVMVLENFIRVNSTYNVFTRDTSKYYFSSDYIK